MAPRPPSSENGGRGERGGWGTRPWPRYRCRMKVFVGALPAVPAAQTSPVAGTAEVPASVVSPDGPFGLATTDQAVPSQCRVSVRASGIVPVRSTAWPTAHTFAGETAVTPDSTFSTSAFGLGTIDHAVPFQCSTSVRSGRLVPVVVSTVFPTAHTSFAPTATTP